MGEAFSSASPDSVQSPPQMRMQVPWVPGPPGPAGLAPGPGLCQLLLQHFLPRTRGCLHPRFQLSSCSTHNSPGAADPAWGLGGCSVCWGGV